MVRSQDDSTDLHDAAGIDARRVVQRGGTTAWSKRSNLTISRRPVVREDATGEIVGTYRMLTPAGSRAAGGLYSDTEFDLAALDGAVRVIAFLLVGITLLGVGAAYAAKADRARRAV